MEHLFDYLLKGGPVMWPLFACAIASVVVMVERFVALIRIPVHADHLMATVSESVDRGDWKSALQACDGHVGPTPIVIACGLRNREKGRDEAERMMEAKALDEVPLLSLRLGILDTVITVAPLLGLLGTVTGMIRAFHVVASASGLSAPTAITSGVAEALIATATGLLIAIVTLVGYNYLSERVKEIVSELEGSSAHLLTLIPSTNSAAA